MELKSFTYYRSAIMLTLVMFGAMSVNAQGTDVATPVDTTTYALYRPMVGHRVAHSKNGELNIRVYTYLRYLNQTGLDSTYVDGFGNDKTVDQRQDIQLQKVSIYFTGWAFDPKFSYFLYVWTSNSSQGQDAQVVVAGNISYTFNKYIKVTGGIMSLPGVRTTEGNFPFWFSVDNRTIADEYMRPSYTSGVQMRGALIEKMSYSIMLGNNMSTLGVDAGQLDDGLNTVAAALVYLPTTGEYGMFNGSYGDYDYHKKVATRVGAHYTRSTETRQGQPSTDAFENVQLRVSDGSPIFTPNLFGDGTQINEARDQMFSLDAGAKYKGFSLEGEYYWRQIDNFEVIGNPLNIDALHDTGVQLLASAMVLPKKLQFYTTYSQVFGEYGEPSEFRLGLNFFPFKKTNYVRLNAQCTFLDKSPVGGLAYPYTVGGNGMVFNMDLEINF
jgi:hypothetical protein